MSTVFAPAPGTHERTEIVIRRRPKAKLVRCRECGYWVEKDGCSCREWKIEPKGKE